MTPIIVGLSIQAIIYVIVASYNLTVFGSSFLLAFMLGSILAVCIFLYTLWHMTNNIKHIVLQLQEMDRSFVDIGRVLVKIRKELE